MIVIADIMAERRFTRGLCKPGMAAQVRENVSQAVKATATQVMMSLPSMLWNEKLSYDKTDVHL